MKPATLIRTLSAVVLLSGLAAFAACSSTKDVEQRQAAAEAKDPSCINHCYPDPPPEPVDCEAAETDVEFYPVPLWDFETNERRAVPNLETEDPDDKIVETVDGVATDPIVYAASNLYTYDDESTDNLSPEGWQPAAIEMQRCREETDQSANHVFHISGGPFLEWGGGMGRHLKCFNATNFAKYRLTVANNEVLDSEDLPEPDAQSKMCGFRPASALQACHESASDLINSICPERDQAAQRDEDLPPDEEYLQGATVDASEWDGISFWARRSPNSQAGIRLAVGDRYTDDDLRFLQYRHDPAAEPYCEIKRNCNCEDANTECARIDVYTESHYARDFYPDFMDPRDSLPTPDSGYYCATAEEQARGYVMAWDAIECGQTACDAFFDSLQAEDPHFYGKPCTEYAMKGSIVEAACFDPATDPLPPENNDLCGDLWLKPVLLSTEWKFFKIPFNELLQQGWAKEAHAFDLTSLALVRFTWERGYIDYWIDDVRFYRNRR